MRFLPLALPVAIVLANPAWAQHAGTFAGMATNTGVGGACRNGMVNVTITESDLTTTPTNWHFSITWSGDAFTGTGPGNSHVKGTLSGNSLTYDMVGTICNYHYDLKRAS
jgi:hypothetical protein